MPFNLESPSTSFVPGGTTQEFRKVSYSVPPAEVPAEPPLGRLVAVSGAAEGWLLELLGATSEACAEVDAPALLLAAELPTCGSTLADVVGTTVGSSKTKSLYVL